MVVTKTEKSAALAALTTAALSLPGLNAIAAVPASQIESNVQYGHYQESDNRMQIDVYHADAVLPLSDRLELSFSLDRDTYSGATPAYSLPATMTNQTKNSQGIFGTADVVSAASGGVTAQGLTVLGGLNTFATYYDGYSALEAQLIAANPEPASPAAPATLAGNVILDFTSFTSSFYGGQSNVQPIDSAGSCPGTGADGCYYEDGMVVGTPYDATNPGAHLHRLVAYGSRQVQYHNDSAGIYIRALNGQAFALNSMIFHAGTTAPGNNVTGAANDYWEILGFNKAIDPNLASGDGTNYATRVAYQTVANGFDGLLTLNSGFSNINAFWIHYAGNPKTPTDLSLEFSMSIDNVNLSGVVYVPAKTADQLAWEAEISKQVTIGLYRAILDSLVPKGTPTVQRFQMQPLETRSMPQFNAKYYFDDTTLAFSGGLSDEPDFLSNFGSVNVSHEFNDKLTTVSAGYGMTRNTITRSTDSAHSSSHHANDPNHNPTDYEALNDESTFHSFNSGISQILTKNTLFQTSLNYTHQNGYLSNPYKYVYVRGEVTPEEYYEMSQALPGAVNWKGITNLEMVGIDLFRENRPDQRNIFSISNRLNQYIPALDASLHFDYRFYSDDWGINSHTFELKWYQSLPWGLTITPGIRYYSQSESDFFAPYFLAPRADGFYSSDFRLSAFGDLSRGVTISKQFARGIKLEAGFEYITHSGALKLGGGGVGDYADFDYYMAHANLNVSFSARTFAGLEHSGHTMHHHHGAPVPAGVMFGHMMNQADEIMVGYRFMYGVQSGSMMHGGNPVDKALVADNACAGYDYGCLYQPTKMHMQMHMLDLMYAPTDWLNIMVMPQLMSMDMTMSQPIRDFIDGEEADYGHHAGTKHNSNDIGDTVTTALVKIMDAGTHHLHAGIGISAPTGSIDAELSPPSLKSASGTDTNPDSATLQDYGMQLGSGTWDLKPSLTYTGHMDDWGWGAQFSGTKRLEKNKYGYAYGDIFQTTGWGSYNIVNWLSATIRGVYTWQDKIRGESNQNHDTLSPVDFPGNYGGRFWDVGLGLNASVPEGQFAGHNISVEWLQPVSSNFNGYQLDRDGALSATWSYTF
ncbi:DUF3570 domain-containing protein [Methylomonas sp. LL1]|uniref:DUF3570 domain-containing protein n=1 Tax=Methylomonas sp. LL1 TaxID=2785785 RepID=UPI0018C36F17|nr:DUF3570 domain-containing protein [Methylomonas sp. LL1]QPK63970.1 DUF3570 domain-containing protein [Methylomonas sp. LL1]